MFTLACFAVLAVSIIAAPFVLALALVFKR